MFYYKMGAKFPTNKIIKLASLDHNKEDSLIILSKGEVVKSFNESNCSSDLSSKPENVFLQLI